MNSCISDVSMVLTTVGQEKIGMIPTYMDDSLYVENESHSDLFKKMKIVHQNEMEMRLSSICWS